MRKLKKTTFENGLICYPMGGTIDGIRGDHVLLAPPFISGGERRWMRLSRSWIGRSRAVL